MNTSPIMSRQASLADGVDDHSCVQFGHFTDDGIGFCETIEALPGTQLAILKSDDFFKIVKKRMDEDYLKLAQFIQSVPMLSSMSSQTALSLRKLSKEEKFCRNQTVFNQGEVP